MRVGVKPGQWGWSWDELVASWRAAEELGFDVVSSWDHVTSAPAGLAAWDAPTLLAAMAGVVSRPALAVDAINSSLRHPFLLAGQLAVAQAASGGRVEVTLGAGSYHLARFDNRALGVRFGKLPERVARLERICRALPALWRGETVDDPELGLYEASLGQLGIEPPPLSVGGTSDGILDLVGRTGVGWNCVEREPGQFVALAPRLDAARPKAVQLFDRDLTDDIRERMAAWEEAGAGTATFALTEETGPDAVRRLAERVL